MKAYRFLRGLALALTVALTLGKVSPGNAAQGSGCLPTTGTVSGLTFAQGVNAALAALISSNSGASAPSTDCSAVPIKGQVWLDTSVTPNVMRKYDGSNWVSVGAIDSVNHLWAPPVGGGTATVTAATTTDICAAPSALQTVNGSTTIASFGSACVPGVRKTLMFSGALTITSNASSMILPGQRDFTTVAGDMAEATYLGSGNWRVSISKIDGGSVTNPAVALGTIQYGDYGTIPAKTVYGAGQALSRSTYPDYFLASTRAQTGTLTSGNNTITSVANTAGLGQGMPIEGTGIQSGTTISSVTSSTIVMSQTATANGSQTVRAIIPGYGTGGDSTTIGVKDCRGRTMSGRDNMNGTAAGVLTAAGNGFGAQGKSPTVINAPGGVEKYALDLTQIPAFTPSVSVSVPPMNVPVPVRRNTSVGGSTDNTRVAEGNDANATDGSINVSTPTTGANVTVASIGGGQAHAILSPTVIAECVVVVLP